MSSPAASASNATDTTGAGNATVEGAAGGNEDEYDAQMLMYHINILLLALLALFFILRLPRALARLWRPSEWLNGHIFRYVPYKGRTHYAMESKSSGYNLPAKSAGLSSDDSHTLHGGAYVQRVDFKGGPIKTAYPPHISACLGVLRGCLGPLRKRITPGFSMAQFMISCVWFGVLVYPTLYKSTGPFTDPVRAGWVGTAQLPFVFAFASKNNVLGAFLGMGYEKLNYLHRFLARVVVLAVNVHSLGYIYKWLLRETFQESIAKPSNYWGLIGLICFDFLFFFSTAWWRKNAYNFFMFTHIIGFLLLFPAMWLHKKAMIPWIYACVAVYGFDMLLRTIKTRIARAIIRPLPELELTRIEIPTINAGWRAGQHVRLRIISSGMGALGWAEVHPFTIASAANSTEGMTLLCKKAGGWTGKLYNMATTGGYMEAGVGRNVKVIVEGPYGGPGHTMFASYSAAVFVVGGSGITFALAAIQELIQKDQLGESRVKVIELVWCVQDPASLVPLLPQFSAMISHSVFTPIKISVYYTRAPVGKFPFPDNFFHPRLSLSPGRPKIGKVLEATIAKTVSLGAGIKDHEKNSGVIVGVCGPVGLADEVSIECTRVDPIRRDQVGGVDMNLLARTFGW